MYSADQIIYKGIFQKPTLRFGVLSNTSKGLKNDQFGM